MSKNETATVKSAEQEAEATKDKAVAAGAALGILGIGLAGVMHGEIGRGISADEGRDVLHELVATINTHTATVEGLPSVEALKEFAHVDEEGKLVLNSDYDGSQLEASVATDGSNLFEDLNTLENYVVGVYGENIPTDFVEVLDKADDAISYNSHSGDVTEASLVGGLGGAAAMAAYPIIRSKKRK